MAFDFKNHSETAKLSVFENLMSKMDPFFDGCYRK